MMMGIMIQDLLMVTKGEARVDINKKYLLDKPKKDETKSDSDGDKTGGTGGNIKPDKN